MSEQKFTPGPWSLCGSERGVCQCFTVSCGDHPIAHVEHGTWGDSYPAIRQKPGTNKLDLEYEAYMECIDYGSIDEEYAKGNARLIAATPDMLEALLVMLKSAVPHPTEHPTMTKAWALGRAAVEKATGEPYAD